MDRICCSSASVICKLSTPHLNPLFWTDHRPASPRTTSNIQPKALPRPNHTEQRKLVISNGISKVVNGQSWAQQRNSAEWTSVACTRQILSTLRGRHSRSGDEENIMEEYTVQARIICYPRPPPVRSSRRRTVFWNLIIIFVVNT